MRILQVVHGFPPAASGGTEVYVRDLSTALAASANDHVAVFTRHADFNARDLGVKRWVDDRVEILSVNNTFHSCDSFESSYANAAIEGIAGDCLDEWQPDVVHVQHLTCLSTGIPRQAARRGIPVVMTLNDYWLICHRGQLVDVDGRRCAGPVADGCETCLPPGALASRPAFQSGRALQSLAIPGVSSMIDLTARAWTAAMPADRLRAATVARLEHMKAAVADIAVFLAPSDTLASTYASFGFPARAHCSLQSGDRHQSAGAHPSSAVGDVADRLCRRTVADQGHRHSVECNRTSSGWLGFSRPLRRNRWLSRRATVR